MKMSIEQMKYRINELELLLQANHTSYISGYTQAMKDHGLLLSDIKDAELNDAFTLSIYRKALDLTS